MSNVATMTSIHCEGILIILVIKIKEVSHSLSVILHTSLLSFLISDYLEFNHRG